MEINKYYKKYLNINKNQRNIDILNLNLIGKFFEFLKKLNKKIKRNLRIL
jgi:hypothetical protein